MLIPAPYTIELASPLKYTVCSAPIDISVIFCKYVEESPCSPVNTCVAYHISPPPFVPNLPPPLSPQVKTVPLVVINAEWVPTLVDILTISVKTFESSIFTCTGLPVVTVLPFPNSPLILFPHPKTVPSLVRNNE